MDRIYIKIEGNSEEAKEEAWNLVYGLLAKANVARGYSEDKPDQIHITLEPKICSECGKPRDRK